MEIGKTKKEKRGNEGPANEDEGENLSHWVNAIAARERERKKMEGWNKGYKSQGAKEEDEEMRGGSLLLSK